jgi:hypothetical protein
MNNVLRRLGYTPSDTVSAGADQTGKLQGQTITLVATANDGSATWAQVAGPSVSLTVVDAVTASFVAPPVLTATVFTFEATNGAAKDQMTVTVNPASSTTRFPGDPGVNKTKVGAVNGVNSGTYPGYPISWFDSRVWPTNPAKKHTIVRAYYSGLVFTTAEKDTIVAWINEGRTPMISWKLGTYTLAQIASGAADAAIDALATWFATLPGPIWASFYHEPEDNFTTTQQQSDYRAAFRRIISRSRAISGVNAKVAWTTMYAEWTFNPASGRDWRNWHPNWDGSAFSYNVLDLEGIDLYDPTVEPNITASSRNKTWAVSVDNFLTKVTNAGQKKPWCIGEYGVYTNIATLDDNGITVPQIIGDMIDIGGLQQDLVGVAAWNNVGARFDDANDPGQVKLGAWQTMVAKGSVVTV